VVEVVVVEVEVDLRADGLPRFFVLLVNISSCVTILICFTPAWLCKSFLKCFNCIRMGCPLPKPTSMSTHEVSILRWGVILYQVEGREKNVGGGKKVERKIYLKKSTKSKYHFFFVRCTRLTCDFTR
jgi:hypothetical protein